MDYYTLKNWGYLKYKNKKLNEGSTMSRRCPTYHSQRGRTRRNDRRGHHSYRKVLKEGIKNGAQTMWLHPTSARSCYRYNWCWFTSRESFQKFRFHKQKQ